MFLSRILILSAVLAGCLAPWGRAQCLDIAAGQVHGLALGANARVWAWGRNLFGPLGDGTTTNRTAPVYTLALNGVRKVGGGQNFSAALMSDGTLMSWGADTGGSLGNGTDPATLVPTPVLVLNNVVDFALGTSHVLALKSDGTVWSWGTNTTGQLGRGMNPGAMDVPVQITTLSGIVSVFAGFNSSLAISNTGQVFVFGANTNGQLGINSTSNVNVPTLVPSLAGCIGGAFGSNHGLFVRNDGVVLSSGSNSSGQLGTGAAFGTSSLVPVVIPAISGAIQVSAGTNFSVVLLDTGFPRTFGTNLDGQLANGMTGGSSNVPVVTSGMSDIVKVSAGSNFGLALRNDGKVFSWGFDGNGERGNGTLPGGGLAGFITPLVLYPGTGEDLRLSSSTSSSVLSEGAGNDFKIASPGVFLNLRLFSPLGGFDSTPYVLGADLHLTGTPPIGPVLFPVIHLSESNAVILAPGPSFGPLQQVLGPGGLFLSFAVPPGFAGASVLIQGISLAPAAANGIFAATDAHQIAFI